MVCKGVSRLILYDISDLAGAHPGDLGGLLLWRGIWVQLTGGASRPLGLVDELLLRRSGSDRGIGVGGGLQSSLHLQLTRLGGGHGEESRCSGSGRANRALG